MSDPILFYHGTHTTTNSFFPLFFSPNNSSVSISVADDSLFFLAEINHEENKLILSVQKSSQQVWNEVDKISVTSLDYVFGYSPYNCKLYTTTDNNKVYGAVALNYLYNYFPLGIIENIFLFFIYDKVEQKLTIAGDPQNTFDMQYLDDYEQLHYTYVDSELFWGPLTGDNKKTCFVFSVDKYTTSLDVIFEKVVFDEYIVEHNPQFDFKLLELRSKNVEFEDLLRINLSICQKTQLCESSGTSEYVVFYPKTTGVVKKVGNEFLCIAQGMSKVNQIADLQGDVYIKFPYIIKFAFDGQNVDSFTFTGERALITKQDVISLINYFKTQTEPSDYRRLLFNGQLGTIKEVVINFLAYADKKYYSILSNNDGLLWLDFTSPEYLYIDVLISATTEDQTNPSRFVTTYVNSAILADISQSQPTKEILEPFFIFPIDFKEETITEANGISFLADITSEYVHQHLDFATTFFNHQKFEIINLQTFLETILVTIEQNFNTNRQTAQQLLNTSYIYLVNTKRSSGQRKYTLSLLELYVKNSLGVQRKYPILLLFDETFSLDTPGKILTKAYFLPYRNFDNTNSYDFHYDIIIDKNNNAYVLFIGETVDVCTRLLSM